LINDYIMVIYNAETDEVEVTNEFGFPTYYKLSDFEPIDANEREFGVEQEYVIGNLHLFFYPEGILSDFYCE